MLNRDRLQRRVFIKVEMTLMYGKCIVAFLVACYTLCTRDSSINSGRITEIEGAVLFWSDCALAFAMVFPQQYTLRHRASDICKRGVVHWLNPGAGCVLAYEVTKRS